MLTSIALFAASRAGRYVFGSAVLLALFVGYTAKQRAIGRAQAIAAMEKKADANAKVADKERDAVRAVPADRLRDRHTRD